MSSVTADPRVGSRVDQSSSTRDYSLLGLAVASIASSAVLVRWSSAPPMAMAFWRTLAGSAALTPAAVRSLRSSRLSGTSARPWVLILVAGLCLGVHFLAWLSSLTMTSAAASVTLVATAPIFVAAAMWALGKPPGRRTLIAVALAVGGSAVIAGGDLIGQPQSLDGDALAVLAAAAAAVYLVIGSQLRASLSTASYAAPTYAVAAALSFVVCLASGTPLTGFDTASWVAIAAMVVGPQLGGHTTLNYLLGRLDPFTVSLSLLSEPILASALVWVLFEESPPLAAWLGAPIVLSGLALQARSESAASHSSNN